MKGKKQCSVNENMTGMVCADDSVFYAVSCRLQTETNEIQNVFRDKRLKPKEQNGGVFFPQNKPIGSGYISKEKYQKHVLFWSNCFMHHLNSLISLQYAKPTKLQRILF